MSLYSIRKNKSTAFSLAEMLVVMLILSVVVLSMIPLAAKRVKRETVNPEHGAFECYYDDQGKLHQVTRDAKGNIVQNNDNVAGGSCIFSPKKGAMFFVVNAVGGGSPGTGTVGAFNGLVYGDRATSSQTEFRGANYTNLYYKFMSKYIDQTPGTTVNFDTVVDTDPEGSGPRSWLKSSYVTLKAILTTDGGKQEFYKKDKSIGKSGGFITLYRYDDNEGCDGPTPDWNSTITDPSGSDKITQCYATYNHKGYSAQRGARLMFPIQVVHGGSFLNNINQIDEKDKVSINGSLSQGNNVQGIGLGFSDPNGSKSVGCFIPKGANGCYYHYNTTESEAEYVANCNYNSYQSQYSTFYDYSSEIECPSSKVFYSGYGYWPEETLNISNTLPSSNSYVHYDTRCYYSTNCDENVRGLNRSYQPCVFDWTWYSYYKELYRMTWGNFILIFQELRKGLNFYAQAGRPGEYKTIYIAKLNGKLKITPGAPKVFNKNRSTSLNNEAGNDTVIEYADNVSDFVLIAKGGKAAYDTNQNTFILGNIFDLLPTGSGVIAHNTNNGDNSGSESEYGGYFKPKNSDFVYPIPDSDEMVPEYVGRGGMGSHTIFRLNAKPNVFKMFRAYDSDKSSSGSTPTEDQSSYTCGDGSVISGSNNAENYRCYGTTGYGGAVVITW